MAEAVVEHLFADIERMKQDLAVIKHILSEEGRLSSRTRKALVEARATPDAEYVSHDELKKRILK